MHGKRISKKTAARHEKRRQQVLALLRLEELTMLYGIPEWARWQSPLPPVEPPRIYTSNHT